MSATLQRDQAIALVKANPRKALEKARRVSEPWFRAQALSWCARYTNEDPIPIAAQAAKAASQGDDDYKRSAVRAWEIAALAERECVARARKSLKEALNLAKTVQPMSSRSEALLQLLQAAFAIHRDDAIAARATLRGSCPVGEHWRCKRAVKDADKMVKGELPPRNFFW
ncbi:MAG: hypothetical protein ACQESR_04420 [Planctomycetota bacterium]